MARLLTTLSVAAVAAVAMISPASASTPPAPPPWMVTAPPAPVGTTVFFKAATISGLQLTDVTASPNQVLTCVSSRIGGQTLTGPGQPGPNILRLQGPSFTASSCTIASVAFKGSGTANWKFNAQTWIPSGGGIAVGRLTSINMTWTSLGCTFTVMGNVPARWFNNGLSPYLQTIPAGNFLTVTSVVGCAGTIAASDVVRLALSYQPVSGANGPIHITP